MDYISEPSRRLPVTHAVDVLVCGGGFAGAATVDVGELQARLSDQGVQLER